MLILSMHRIVKNVKNERGDLYLLHLLVKYDEYINLEKRTDNQDIGFKSLSSEEKIFKMKILEIDLQKTVFSNKWATNWGDKP